MHAQGEFANMRLPLVVDGAALDIAAIHRPGERPPILFLHGFGSTKEDYADIVRHPAFDGRPFVAYDAPGCGETACATSRGSRSPSWSRPPRPCSITSAGGRSTWSATPWAGSPR